MTDWRTSGGDSWALRWRETDRALAGLSPHLLSAALERVPAEPFRAFDVGCGAGSTSLALAAARPDCAIVACDVSPALAAVARQRSESVANVEVQLGDAAETAARTGPFDLIVSRHGVMFFPDPVEAFAALRSAARPAASLVFSCFRDWSANPWASELACAAAGRALPPPGREPSGFAFADPDYVEGILRSAGWSQGACRPVDFSYVAGEGAGAVEEALSLLSEIGPASRAMSELPEQDRPAALERMRGVIEDHRKDGRIEFPAAVWIWSARSAANA